jgi:hypothetical protein
VALGLVPTWLNHGNSFGKKKKLEIVQNKFAFVTITYVWRWLFT